MKPRTTYVQVERAVTSRLCSPVETLPEQSTKSTSSGGSWEMNPLSISATSGESGDLTGRRWFSLIFCHWMLLAEWPCLEPRRFPKINMSLSKDLEDTKARSSAEILQFPVTEAAGMSRLWFISVPTHAHAPTHEIHNYSAANTLEQYQRLFFPGLSVNNEGWNRRWTKHVVLFWRLKLSGTLLREFLQCLKYV